MGCQMGLMGVIGRLQIRGMRIATGVGGEKAGVVLFEREPEEERLRSRGLFRRGFSGFFPGRIRHFRITVLPKNIRAE